MKNIDNSTLTPKEKCIMDAFGQSWYKLPINVMWHLLNISNGWVDRSRMRIYPSQLQFTDDQIDENCEFWRPKSLDGIENNNGWIHINDDGSNLPEDDETVFYRVWPMGNPITMAMTGRGVRYTFKLKNHIITHYKLVEKIKPPLH